MSTRNVGSHAGFHPLPSPPPSSPPSATPLAPLLRLLRLSLKAQWLVGGSCALAALAYPQVEVYGFLLGAVCNAFTSKLLKRIIKQDRPLYRTNSAAGGRGKAEGTANGQNGSNGSASSSSSSSSSSSLPSLASSLVQEATSEVVASAVDTALFAADSLGVDHPAPDPLLRSLPHPQRSEKHLGHGMPSSHAMSLFFFSIYLALTALDPMTGSVVHSFKQGVEGEVVALPHPFVQMLQAYTPAWLLSSWRDGWARPALLLLMYTLVIVECSTRIKRRLHSWQQITVGALLGSLLGYVHYHFVMPMVREWSAEVPPLSDRSTEFKVVVTISFTIVAALTLERNTQRVAKRLLRSFWRWLRTRSARPVPAADRRNSLATAKGKSS